MLYEVITVDAQDALGRVAGKHLHEGAEPAPHGAEEAAARAAGAPRQVDEPATNRSARIGCNVHGDRF